MSILNVLINYVFPKALKQGKLIEASYLYVFIWIVMKQLVLLYLKILFIVQTSTSILLYMKGHLLIYLFDTKIVVTKMCQKGITHR